jgi:hypothetical protein
MPETIICPVCGKGYDSPDAFLGHSCVVQLETVFLPALRRWADAYLATFSAAYDALRPALERCLVHANTSTSNVAATADEPAMSSAP